MNIELNLSERQLEDVVESHLKSINDTDRSRLSLRNLNLLTYGGKVSVFRQLNLGAWRCDLLTHERKGSTHYINLFELKTGEANGETLTQAFKYKVQIERYLKQRGISDFFIRIHLLAPFNSYDLNFLQGLEGDGFDLSISRIQFYTNHGVLFNKYYV